MYRKFLYILNSFGVHMIWLISVLSLIPKGEIVGIKLVLPLVTTLSNITDSTELRSKCSVYRVMQCLPGYAVFTEYRSEYSVHQVQFRIQCSLSTVQNEVSTGLHSIHRVQYRMQCSPSHHSGCSDYRGTMSTK